MKNMSCLAALMATAALLAGCGGGDSTPVGFTAPPPAPAVAPAPPAPPPVQLAAPSAVAGLTQFYQVITNDDVQNGYAVPGVSPNVWDLDSNMSLEDGGTDQFDTALELSITSLSGTTTASGFFPFDQTYPELTYLTPEYAGATGTAGVVFSSAPVFNKPSNSTTIAWLTPSQDSRVQQTITVPSVGAGTLTWDTVTNGLPSARKGYFNGENDFYRVVLRNSAGAIVGTLYNEQNGSVVTGTAGVADMTPYSGQTLALSFEARATYTRNSYGPGIDNVSFLHGVTQLITNGTFEAGSTGWTTNQPVVSQNVASGTRTVANLTVQRTVYVPPTEKWGRWTDSFTNPTSTTITATVSYSTDLGSDDSGIIYSTPGTAGRAVTSWDGDSSDRDVAMVYGNNAAPQPFISDDALGASNGSDMLSWDYHITVAPGASVTIVQFIVMPAVATWQTPGVTIATKATEADAIALDITTNFRNNVKYRHGMTQKQIDTLFNF